MKRLPERGGGEFEHHLSTQNTIILTARPYWNVYFHLCMHLFSLLFAWTSSVSSFEFFSPCSIVDKNCHFSEIEILFSMLYLHNYITKYFLLVIYYWVIPFQLSHLLEVIVFNLLQTFLIVRSKENKQNFGAFTIPFSWYRAFKFGLNLISYNFFFFSFFNAQKLSDMVR